MQAHVIKGQDFHSIDTRIIVLTPEIELAVTIAPPPIGRVVNEFLKICSKPKNLIIDRVTVGCSLQRMVKTFRGYACDPYSLAGIDALNMACCS